MNFQEGPSEGGSLQAFGALPRPRLQWRSLAWQATVGFLFGYAVLHPASMVVFRWLDPRVAAAAMANGRDDAVLGPIAHSFHLGMLPMGLVFGAIGTLITVFYGLHRLTVTTQRDRLAEQAKMLKQNNRELARLELANRRTSQFMAHDIKSALGCVSGFAGQLLEQHRLREDADVAEALGCIRRQAHQIMGSVMDLLEFARVREGGIPRMTRISAKELLEEAVGDFSLPVLAEHITLGDKHRCSPPLTADPKLLRRVLCNLISNAVKHNQRNTHIWLDAQVDESRPEVPFSCCDDGAGVSPEVLPSIFTEFTGTDDASGQSTGLGLAFCKSVVEAHGGRIWCETIPEQGARFFFTVPLPKEPNNDR